MHRCDDWSDPNDTPLTRARVQRLLAALLDRDDDAVNDVVVDLGGCHDCWKAALVMSAATTVLSMPAGDIRSMIALNLHLDADHDDPQE